MENSAEEKRIRHQDSVSPSELMVDFPAERFRVDPEASEPQTEEMPAALEIPAAEGPQAEEPPAEGQGVLPDQPAEQPASDTPKSSAPWFCVLPVILFGAACALIPDSQASLRSALGIWIAVLALCALIAGVAAKRVKIRRGPFNIAFICCAAALIISYLLSPYKETALMGAEGSMEGTLFLLSCVLIMFCAVNVMRGRAALISAVWTAAAVFAARGVFSVFGYFGKEIGRSDIILLSGGACLVFMLFAGQLALGRFTGSVRSFVLWAVLLVFIAAAVRNDLISFAASVCAVVIILAVLHFRTILNFAKPALLLLLAAAFVLIPSWKIWMPEMAAQNMDEVQRVKMESIMIDGNTAYMLFEDYNTLVVKTQANASGRFTKVEFTRGTGEPLTLSEDKNEPKMYIIDEEPYQSFVKSCIIRGNDADLLRIETSGYAWYFSSDGSRLHCVSSLGEAVIPGSYKPRQLATGCRYLRERQAVRLCAQEISEKYAQYGCGADCFGTVYPPDRVFRYNSGLDASAETEDPKSLYLLAGIQTGRVTLCAFASFAVIYAVLYILGLRGERQFADGRPERAAILAAVLCLALSGITNSPKAGTLPLFFVLLGTGIAAEYKR